jgi:deoxyribonuclease IV
MRQYSNCIGDFSLVGAIRIDNSKQGLGSRVDRHEKLVKGTLPVAAFQRIVKDDRLRHAPMILEMPSNGAEAEYAEEIRLLRSLPDP